MHVGEAPEGGLLSSGGRALSKIKYIHPPSNFYLYPFFFFRFFLFFFGVRGGGGGVFQKNNKKN